MSTIKAQLIVNNNVVKTLKKSYDDDKSFYMAYVEICYEMDIDIPFWTSEEEKQFKRNHDVVFNINQNTKLLIKAS